MKTFKVRLGDLRRVLREEILREEGEAPAPPAEEPGEDSLDSQVDRYLNDYEKEAKSAKTEGRDWRMTVRRIVEAGEDDDKGDDSSDEPKKLTVEDIDVGSFVNGVVRLIDNYDSLLEVRNTILRRASNFLSKNYDESVADSFKEQLRNEHGMEIGKSRDEMEDEFTAPPADRAGDGGVGGGGAVLVHEI